MKLCVLFLMASLTAFAQEKTVLCGQIENPIEQKLYITLYPNYLEEPIDFEINLSEDGSFKQELDLYNYAYLDLNYRNLGLYQFNIEPADSIYFNLNASQNLIKASGLGEAKVNFAIENQKIEENKPKLLELNSYEFKKRIAASKEQRISLLNSFHSQISDEFYELKKADILGDLNKLELDYLINNKQISDRYFSSVDLEEVNPIVGAKSWVYSSFTASLINSYLNFKKLNFNSATDKFVYIKGLTFNNNTIPKPYKERYLGNLLLDQLFAEKDTYANEILLNQYQEYSENAENNLTLSNKFEVIKELRNGKELEDFEIEVLSGRPISKRLLRAKNVLVNFYYTDCGPCKKDMDYIKSIEDYFNVKKDFVVLNIAKDSKEEFEAFLNTYQPKGLSGFAGSTNEIYTQFNVTDLPHYALISKSGTIISTGIKEPSENEGKALINQMEQLFYLNTGTNEKKSFKLPSFKSIFKRK